MSTKSNAIQSIALALVLVVTTVLTVPVQAAQQDAPDRSYAADSILVRFRDSATPAEKANAHAQVGVERVREYSLVPGLQNIHLKANGLGVEAAVERLSRLPFVAYAEPDYIVHAVDTIPNDPSYSQLWGMANIHAPAAWDTFTGDTNFVVASIDTGVDYNHADLAANMWTNPGEIDGDGIDNDGNGYIDDIHGWDFAYGDSNPMDVQSHGSHTSGTIGAAGNNGVGVAGVNWNVKIMALKFLDDSGSGTNSNAILALQYAVAEGVKVSNNSWGGGGYDQSFYDALAAAREKGHIFVAAAGNGNIFGWPINNDTTPFYPASYNLDNVISVAAIDANDAKASFSNYGLTSVDLGAPGVSILSTTPGNAYASKSGTSMATPHVSGVVALVYAQNPTWTYAQVKDRVLSTARPISALAGKTVTGGTLDAGAALAPVVTKPPAAPSNLNATAVSSSQINLSWTDNSTDESGFKIDRCLNLDCTSVAKTVTVGANVTAYADTGLSANTTYGYRVLAYNLGGNSAYSNIASATTQAAPAVPAAPSILTAKAASKTQINLSWTDNANNEDGYYVERCKGTSTCTSYTVIATLGANATTYQNTRLSRNTTYTYRVRAFNAAGTSGYSNTATAKTLK